jgi:hypothetical protein
LHWVEVFLTWINKKGEMKVGREEDGEGERERDLRS